MSKQIVDNLATQLNQSYSNLSNRQHQLNIAQSSLQSVSSHLSNAMTQQLNLKNAINEQTFHFNAIANLLNLYRESEGLCGFNTVYKYYEINNQRINREQTPFLTSIIL